MFDPFRHVAVSAAPLLVVLCAVILPGAPPTYAHPPVGCKCVAPVAECGKAQVMISRALAEEAIRPGRAGMLEPMGDTDVLHYDLDIEVTDINPGAGNCTITGANRMLIRSQSPALTEFTFRLREQFAVTSALINDATPVTVTTESVTTRRAVLDRTYGMGEEFPLTIEYTGTSVPEGWNSIYVTTQSGIPIVSTLAAPYFSFTWWPVKDGDFRLPGDNSDKSTLALSITVPDHFMVPSNGLLQSIDYLADSQARHNWVSNYPVSPYLVSFAATEYNTWTLDYVHAKGTMPVEFYIYPSNDNPSNRAAWGEVVDMLETFAQLFGEYPFIDEKYGIYNFPFGGGMENQTMTGQGSFGESLTAHELAHQWWGDMLTCKTWSDVWLNEGFAEYSECLWEEFKTGTPNPSAYHIATLGRKPSGAGAGDTVYVYPEDIAAGGLNRIYNVNYSYLKGAWVLHQLRHVVGTDTFFDILADFRAAYEFSAATTDEFAAIAANAHGSDLTWFFDQWVYNAGAPEYEYAWDTINADGQDYLLARIKQVQPFPQREVFIMPVDLVVTIDGSPQTLTVWNDQRRQYFEMPVSGPVTAVEFDPNDWILSASAVQVPYGINPPTAEPGGPACDDPGDCMGAYAGADCVGGLCYVPKNRYLSIDPTTSVLDVALRMELIESATYPTAQGRTWWLDEPQCHDYPNGDIVVPPPATCDEGPNRFGWVAKLTTAPVTRTWIETPLHITGCGIAPDVTYEVRTLRDGGALFTEPLIIATAHNPEGDTQSWGDVSGGPVEGMPGLWLAPERATNLGDVSSAIRTFENRGESTGFPPRTWVDVEIDQVINLSDVSFIVMAFEGRPYRDINLEFIGVHPADCP